VRVAQLRLPSIYLRFELVLRAAQRLNFLSAARVPQEKPRQTKKYGYRRNENDGVESLGHAVE